MPPLDSGTIEAVPRVARRRLALNLIRHYLLGVSLDALNAETRERRQKQVLDYWAWDHWNLPAIIYLYTRSVYLSAFIDWGWEIVERGSYMLIGKLKGLPMDNPDAWPDALRPETAFNSVMNDMPNGLCGILFAKMFVWAFDVAPLRGLPTYEADTPMVLQLLLLALGGAFSGSGFYRMYLFGGFEMFLFFIMNYFWNSAYVETSSILLWLAVMATTITATTLARFTAVREPIFTLYLGISIAALVVFSCGIARH